MEPLLEVRNLSVRFPSPSSAALHAVSFDVARGETVGVLGQSGAGKTTLARALVGLLSKSCRVEGSVRFRQQELLDLSDREFEKLRGSQISIIPQEPELALNPVLRIGRQVDEVLRAHTGENRVRRLTQVEAVLQSVGLSEPRIRSAYAHQLSGGQRQRVVISQAIISKPALLVADEPTHALDNVVQADVLELLRRLKRDLSLAMLFITHNPALLHGFADRVIVMQGGCVVESGEYESVFRRPVHAYTKSLLNAARIQPECSGSRPNGR
jgi:peptide/nickel transport system ATP-binding protein